MPWLSSLCPFHICTCTWSSAVGLVHDHVTFLSHSLDAAHWCTTLVHWNNTTNHGCKSYKRLLGQWSHAAHTLTLLQVRQKAMGLKAGRWNNKLYTTRRTCSTIFVLSCKMDQNGVSCSKLWLAELASSHLNASIAVAASSFCHCSFPFYSFCSDFL